MAKNSDRVVKVEDLSKVYTVWEKPSHRFSYILYKYFLNLFPKNKFTEWINGKLEGRRRKFSALEGVSFEIYKGQSVGIVGRNGSGKSTLLQIIAGTLKPTTGNVEVKGRVAALLELGSGFNPEFTGKENVYLNGAILGVSRKEMDAKYNRIESFADIGDFINQPIKTYSSGMVLRLAFAVQILVDPDILIVDEALSVGDSLFQKRCFQRINELVENGTTLIFVSHDIDSVRTLTKQALFLDNGKLRYNGPSSEVVLEYRRFLHQQEKEYLESVARNAVEKKKTDHTRSLKFEIDGKTSFGDLDAYIEEVLVLDNENNEKQAVYANEKVRVKVRAIASIPLSKINVGLRIRNKEGIKMYSWGTLNQDMRVLAEGRGDKIFWNRQFNAGERIEVDFEFTCTLGPNFYEIQASISEEETPDYNNQRMLHWKDEAAYFNVGIDRDKYFFGGVMDLRMSAKIHD